MNKAESVRPGAASIALLGILLITAAWWALALWPAGAVEPAWLLRTRAACFGSIPGGLPDAGGWILLIGEPIGMLGFLVLVWGKPLRSDLQRLSADRRWRQAMVAVVVVLLLGMTAAGRRVAYASGIGAPPPRAPSGTLTKVDIDASEFVLTDQAGRRASLADVEGGTALLTFAFGHCTDICPTIVHDIRTARRAANRAEVPILIVTLDPWRDTPEQLPSIAAGWQLDPGDRVFSGSVAEVERTLDALGVGRQRDGTSGDVSHGGMVMLLDARGHVTWRLDGGWGQVQQLLAATP
jgi:cytochrome oxidase Cu insertion factor (SCO1/SenC/PrrC family)